MELYYLLKISIYFIAVPKLWVSLDINANTLHGRIYYKDGLIGSGLPVTNVIFQGQNTLRPIADTCDFWASLNQDYWRFVRGDVNSDSEINLTDAILILSFLFTGGPAPACMDAADADDNRSLQITDAIRILNWLFVGMVALLRPSPTAPQYPTLDCGLAFNVGPGSCEKRSNTCE